jgi:peptidyl-tRNA hydrolase, PTH1 family
MRLLVGLGNPGQRYAHNRHNVGFMVIDAIARRHDIGPWRRHYHFQSVDAEGLLGGERAILLKPGTFMNESGRAVAEAAHFRKINVGDLLVFHDDIELPPAKVRVKTGGSDAGHNGLRSISSRVGSEYRRVRIGVGRPPFKDLVMPYVLSDFGRDEWEWVEALCDIIADNAALIVAGKDSSFQNKVHLTMQAKGFGDMAEPGKPKPPAQ